MGSRKVVVVMGFVMMLSRVAAVTTSIDCTTVIGLISACTTFVTYGSPDPMPGSPCCDAVGGLNSVADSSADGPQTVCRCLMGLLTTYNPNATAIATLPGFCGVSLGFTIDPNTDCNL
ncbi:hypothetical protein Vadar_023949 [Vaccinium darrowii]|uniref:Uncharacterized protein n=1 Tax=Vaccinium darrowii TaxID=229202 RepID=A0ACB7YPD4_9ERIC|nr:hypothetical protein Vadar_023949 [Vaccinium darrowii]